MYISNELKKRNDDLKSEHKQFIDKMIDELNPKIIDYNTDLGKYFLIEHLIEKLSGLSGESEQTTIELLKTMKYKESSRESSEYKNEYEMTSETYETTFIRFENSDGNILKFYKSVKDWYHISDIEIKLDDKKLNFDWNFMKENIDDFMTYKKDPIEYKY